jgi:hypothetical protein
VIELLGRFLLIIPFYEIIKGLISEENQYWLILLGFGLVSLFFRVYVRLGLVYIFCFLFWYYYKFGSGLEILWLVGGLIVLGSNINKRVVEVIPIGSVLPVRVPPVEDSFSKYTKVEKVDPLSKYNKVKFIDWFLGKGRKGNPPAFYFSILVSILGLILLGLSDFIKNN